MCVCVWESMSLSLCGGGWWVCISPFFWQAVYGLILSSALQYIQRPALLWSPFKTWQKSRTRNQLITAIDYLNSSLPPRPRNTRCPWQKLTRPLAGKFQEAWWVTGSYTNSFNFVLKIPCRRLAAGSKHVTVLLQLQGLGHVWVTSASNCRWARPVQAVGSRRWAGWTQPCRVRKLERDASGCKTCRPTAAMEFLKQEDSNGKTHEDTFAKFCKYELHMAFKCVWCIRVPLEVGCFIRVDESRGSMSCDSTKKDYMALKHTAAAVVESQDATAAAWHFQLRREAICLLGSSMTNNACVACFQSCTTATVAWLCKG